MHTTNTQQEAITAVVFDGGGIRGLSSLLILRNILYRIQQAKRLESMPLPCEVFSMITGTGTGGLIALMLGRLRMSVDEAIHVYQQLLTQVFSGRRFSGDGKIMTANLERVIKAVVKSKTDDQETLLRDDNEQICQTFVCAMNLANMNARIPQLFRTYPSPHEESIDGCTVWQAARATSATPTLFKPIRIGTQSFIDGGLSNNNPTLITLEEIKRVFQGRQVASIVSLGTGKSRTLCIPKNPSLRQCVLPLDMIKLMQSMATDCESVHEQIARRFANVPDIYFRLNVEQGLQSVILSEWEKPDIVEAHARQYMKLQDVESKLSKLAEVLEARAGRVLAEEISSTVSFNKHINKPIPGYPQCPPPSTIFTGRRDILDKMHDVFSDNGKQHAYLLYGPGGAGKTQIALKFIWESQIRRRFSETFFIDASTDITLHTSFETIARSKKLGETLCDALCWLQSRQSGKWLLLFNNADNTSLNLFEYFPRCGHGNILITSRNHLHKEHTPSASQFVSEMNKIDARNLLLLGLKEQNIDAADKIVSELHCFALAIVHARAYIQTCCCPLGKFLELYCKNREHILKADRRQKSDNYKDTVFTTFDMSFCQLSNRAATFLQITSFMHYEGLTEEVFSCSASNSSNTLPNFRSADGSWDSYAFHEVLSELMSFSLVELDQRNNLISIHPFVHFCTQNQAKDGPNLIQTAQMILATSTRWEFEVHDYAHRRMLLPHVEQAINNGAHMLVPSSMPIFALIYKENGLHKKAEVLEVVVMDTRRQVLGDKHPETLASMGNLASTLYELGQWKEAEELGMVVMETRKQVLGVEHPDTLNSMANLALILCQLGQLREAEELGVVVMERRKRVLGDMHPDTLASMGNLASTLSELGQLREAEALKVAVMQTRKQVLGDDHPDTLTSMANFALTLHQFGKLKEAEELGVVVMETRKRVLGDEHPHALNSMANMALILCQLGRLQEAEELGVAAVETTKQVLGDEHPCTLTSMGNLAQTLCKLGRLKEAKELGVVVMETRKQVLGGEHPDTLTSMGNLASTLGQLGHLKEAKELEVVAMKTMKRVLGDGHPDTLTSMGNLASTLCQLGHLKDAEELEMTVMKIRKHMLGIEHPCTLTSMGNLARILRKMRRLKEAEELGVAVMETRKRVLGNEHPDTLRSMEKLAWTLRESGRVKEAKALEDAVKKTRTRQYARSSTGEVSLSHSLSAQTSRWRSLLFQLFCLKQLSKS